ncbi:MAG: response regulator, partial [Acidobacteria bacterium]|nr:response regulator [Acidobacteriota bacterium]
MSKHKILAVDDSQTILKILEMILTQAGYEVYTAEDGLEGINMAKEVKPDLVILDFIMPKMNGFQVCKALRKDNELKDVPIIVMSAKGEKVGDKFINIMGAIDYLTKPFSPEALLSLIPEVLKKIEAKRTVTGSMPPIEPGEFKREFSTEQEVILNTIRNQVYTNFESVADTIMKTKSRGEIIEIISDVLSESLSEGLFEDLKIKFEKIIS